MKEMISWSSICVSLLFCLLSNLHAQRSEAWKQANDRKDRYEGTYSRQVGNPDLELVSLTTGLRPYVFGQRKRLKLRFYSPSASRYKLHAEDVKGTQFYWWEDKHRQTSRGWHQSPAGWPVDYLLRKLNIRANNLGILAELEGIGRKKFAPVQVYSGGQPSGISRYVALLRLGRAAAGGTYTVHEGESRRGRILLQKGVAARSGGSILALSIPAKVLPAGTWVFVELTLKERGTLDPFTYSFQFYVPASS
ncbi:MAG: hypothetical protein AAF587_21505 [Bacteroidota bacterium]